MIQHVGQHTGGCACHILPVIVIALKRPDISVAGESLHHADIAARGIKCRCDRAVPQCMRMDTPS